MFLLYYGYYELWEVFVPTTLSAVMMVALVLLKYYYEGLSPERTAKAAAAGDDEGGDSEPWSKRESKRKGSARTRDASRRSSEAQPLMSSW